MSLVRIRFGSDSGVDADVGDGAKPLFKHLMCAAFEKCVFTKIKCGEEERREHSFLNIAQIDLSSHHFLSTTVLDF